MIVYKNAEQLYQCIGGMLEKAKADEAMGQKIRKESITIRFIYKDLDAQITVDACSPADEGEYTVYCGECDVSPELEMTMNSDVAHKFWLGKVNLMAALTRGQIIAKGPVNKALKLLPAIKPTYNIYKEHLLSLGLEGLINAN